VAAEIRGWGRYHGPSVTEQTPSPPQVDAPPVDPISTHAASPFIQTEAPTPVAFASPPPELPLLMPSAALSTHKNQIYFGFSILAYLMVLVGSVTVVQANSQMNWKYYVAILPVIPAGLVIWLTVRALGRMDEVQKRTQMQALGFSMAATGLVTFGYGFLEGAGLPHVSSTFVLPLMTVLWGTGLLALSLRVRFRR
jgi:hypothetical protein